MCLNTSKRRYVKSVDGLIGQVMVAFDEFEPRKLEFGFLTLQCCLNEMLAIHGMNNYRIPHMGKESLLKKGLLPSRLRVSEAAMAVAMEMVPDMFEIMSIA